jgi:hypothetical protein
VRQSAFNVFFKDGFITGVTFVIDQLTDIKNPNVEIEEPKKSYYDEIMKAEFGSEHITYSWG